LFKAWLNLRNQKELSFFSINNIDYLESIKKELNYKEIDFVEITHPKEAIEVFKNKIPIINIPLGNNTIKAIENISSLNEAKNKINLINRVTSKVILGIPNVNHVAFVVNSLEKALEYAKYKVIDAITTMPIEKYVMKMGNFNFIGHTEYL